MIELMIMCVCISVVAIPLMFVYSSGASLPGLAVYSLGSLGGSNSICTQTAY